MDELINYLLRIEFQADSDLLYWQRMTELHPFDDLVHLRMIKAICYHDAVMQLVHEIWSIMHDFI